MNTKLV